ncbi:hypothetical protein TSMG0129 [Halocynthia phage JM-2012]|uniref:hypothetical protein n=1 Tax=Halocynthia phage JM-2012 TaxID=1173297 RepID=UPI00025C695D|nr:hypothetical protein TSMG0129 [Halocynthia phage JM-2012]AFI55412.1 hypothetical protein TSMG0129 [Halocynthia phage JM-2012]
MKNVPEVFKTYCGHVKIDNKWVGDFEKYVKSIMVKNDNHVNFFGSILVGVYPVFFDRGDVNYLWDILIEVDRDEVRGALHSVPYIDPKWQVGGDETNHLLFYLLHRVLTGDLSEKVKESTATNLLFIMQFKFLTSLFYRDYRYGVDRELALTVYNKLSRRFILRQVDSWKELIYLQANGMLHGTDKRKDMASIIKSYRDDKLITDTITGISTNLNSMMKEYNAVFHRVKDESDKVSLDNNIGTNAEGEATFKDNLKNPIRYQMYLESNVTLTDTFLSDDLLEVITKANNSRYKPIRKTLAHISGNYGQRRQDHIKEFVDHTLEFGLSKIRENQKDIKNIREVFDILIGAFSSSRSLDPTLEQLKKIGEVVIKDALGNKTHNNTITLTRTTLMVYICLWTIINI